MMESVTPEIPEPDLELPPTGSPTTPTSTLAGGPLQIETPGVELMSPLIRKPSATFIREIAERFGGVAVAKHAARTAA